MGVGSKFGILAETGNNIVTDGLVFNMDAAAYKSYPRTGTNIYNLASGSLTPTGSMDGSGWEGINPTSSFTFDGVDDQINLSDYYPSVAPDTGLTFNIWMKINAAAGDPTRAWGTIISNWNDQNYCFIGTQLNNPTNIQVYFDGSLKFTFSTSEGIAYQTWFNMVITQNGGTSNGDIIGYINGVQKKTGTDKLPTQTSGVTSIGYDINRGNYPFLGEIASLQIYNRALSAAEVLQNYNAGKDRFGL